jgi:hypothetical protein
VDRLSSRKNRALPGAPVIKRRQKFVSRPHLEGSQFLLCLRQPICYRPNGFVANVMDAESKSSAWSNRLCGYVLI